MPATSGKARAAGWSAPLAGASSRSPSALSGRPLWLIGAASAWMATLGNAALWRGLQQLSALDGVRGLGFAAGLALAIAALLTLLLGLLAWRATLKPALVVMLLATAAGAHFMLAYGVVIDPTMMVNVLHTDAQVMPRRADAWSSWNVDRRRATPATLSYGRSASSPRCSAFSSSSHWA